MHQGLLKIQQEENGTLVFFDSKGHPLAHQADLELGSWLDYHIGWEDNEHNSFQHRVHAED